MEKLLKYIYSLLSAKYTIFSHKKVEQKPTDFPYVTFYIPSGNSNAVNYQLDDLVLYVDIWDIGDSEIQVEQLTDEIVTLLDRRKVFMTNQLQACFYLSNRLALDDVRPEINRRQLSFQVRTYLLNIKKEEIL
jgi:hypothetical protein